MENKFNHIDDFLFQKLQTFEDNPDIHAFNSIHQDLTHLDGTDLITINQQLSQFEENPEPFISKSIIDAAQHLKHPIDYSLNKNLHLLEEKPDNVVPIFQQEQKSRKKLFLFFIIATVVVSSLAILTLNSNKNIDKNNGTIKQTMNQEIEPEKLNITEQNYSQNKPFKSSERDQIPSLNKQIQTQSSNSIANSYLEIPIDYFSEDYELVYDSIKNHKVFKLKITYDKLRLEPIKKFNIHSNKDIVQLADNQNLYLGSFKNQHKVFYEFGIGLNNINYNKQQLNTEYIHKDALKLLQQTLGNFEAGQSLRANIGYHLNHKIQLISGINFDFQSYSNQVNYVYTDIPIYDLNNGKVLSYLTRPASSSPTINQKIRTKVNEIKIPLSISFHVFRIHKTSVWTSIGAIYNLKNTINSQYFSFKDGSLNPYSNQVKTSNNTSVFAQIRAITPISQSLKLVVQFGVNKSQNKMTLYNQNFSYNQLTPNINLGLHFNLKFNPVK